MVYNGTSSVLNKVIFPPNFYFPTVSSTLREAEKGKYMADRYIGEVLLNFMLKKDVRPYCRVDISNARTEE